MRRQTARILSRNTAEAQPLDPLRRKCLFLEPAPSFQPNKNGCLSSPRPGLRAFFGEQLLVFRLHAHSLRVPPDLPFWSNSERNPSIGADLPGLLTG